MAISVSTHKPGKIFYGWWVIWVIVIGAFFSAALSQVFTGAMLPAIASDTGWSRASITYAVSLGSIMAGLVAPFFGRLADIHGSRMLSVVGLLVAAAAMVAVAYSAAFGIVVFYGAYIIGRAISQNCLSGVVPRTAVVNWFRRMRGRAMGFTQMALPLGSAIMFPIFQVAMGRGLTWKSVFLILSLCMLAIVPLAVLVLRRRPEDMGLLPDGDDALAGAQPSAKPAKQHRQGDVEHNYTLKQAARTRSFWMLNAALSLGVCANGALSFHQVAYFMDKGLAAAMAATALSVYALSGALANGIWGFLVERMSERVIAAFTVLCAGLITFFLLMVDTPAEAILFAALFGLAARGESSLILMMQAEYYGRNSFGAISGFSTPFQQIALGLGPTVAVIPYQLTGSYTVPFVAFGFMYVVAATLIWFAKKPGPPPAETSPIGGLAGIGSVPA